jgi:hypothetical protein
MIEKLKLSYSILCKMLDFVLQIEIDERTCTLYLLALKSCDLLLFYQNKNREE